MTKADLERFTSLLLSSKRRLSGDVSHLTDETLRSHDGERTPVADPADQGADIYEQELSLHLLENQEQTLEQIDEALKRIDKGTFGQCEECGIAIPRSRLQAIPYVRHCVACARKLQS